MEASARITCQFLGLKEGDTALLCMPLDYIAGKMMVVRSLTCGLRLIAVEPTGTPYWDEPVDFAAMVPLQVWNLLQEEEGRYRLQQIRHLIIGGGAINDELADALKDFPNQIYSTYGMTETLSHIALRRLNGPERSDWYTPFEGVDVSLNDENCLVINAPAVHDGPLVTNDIAELSKVKGQRSKVEGLRSNVHFRIMGRKDNVICSGGIKIQIEEVERLLKPHLSAPFMITKRADKKFGEQVVLLTESMDMDDVRDICQQVLPKYWQPRSYAHIDALPMTETGKPARKEAERWASGVKN
jgi:O-succinylbenzoic acid--CoA ligase